MNRGLRYKLQRDNFYIYTPLEETWQHFAISLNNRLANPNKKKEKLIIQLTLEIQIQNTAMILLRIYVMS